MLPLLIAGVKSGCPSGAGDGNHAGSPRAGTENHHLAEDIKRYPGQGGKSFSIFGKKIHCSIFF